tara:strand:+ start:4136 stop:6637 length:2502 start_codon:yes stop_codon:yes gene_type:complete
MIKTLIGCWFASAASVVIADSSAFQKEIQPYLQEHCVQCHGPKKQKGDFRVDKLGEDFTDRSTAAAWIEIRDKINLGEMPPDDEPLPEIEHSETVSRWIAGNLREAERLAISTGGSVLMRRMNRHEYTHTVSDLLSMKFPTGKSPLEVLPPDGTAEGFDKVSAALLLDPSLMHNYYEVARQIADRAIVDGPPEFPTETMRMEFEEIAQNTAIRYQVRSLGMQPVEGGLRLIDGSTRSFARLKYPDTNKTTPTSGFYRFTVRVGAHRGEDGTLPRLRVSQAHPDETQRTIMEFDVEVPWDQPREYSIVVPRDKLGGEVNVSILNGTSLNMSQRPGEAFMRRNSEVGSKGDFTETIRLSGRKTAEGWDGERSTPDPEKLDITKYHRVFLDYIEVEGPLYDQWPPKSHTTLLFKGDDAEQSIDYAREIFTRFLPKAWRRPISSTEVDPIVSVVKTELENGQDFNDAIRVGLTVALTSPKFLYIVEPSAKTEKRPLNDFELASRLSYFLWNSMPDDDLFDLAEAGKLRNPGALQDQIDRMLEDPKFDRFVEGFGAQWLRTDTFSAFEPNERVYRDYDYTLGKAAVQEPLEFFRVLLKEKKSVLNFIDSEFAVVNKRLARHYQIEGVDGDHFRPVALPADSPRGGLLGMMGVHLAGADGIRTKPVSRAVYVREVLFNDPPDPPPPNAGEVEPNIQGKKLTVRERLIQHQEIETCAACHRSLDPYGLALENFNVIGSWREQQDGENFRGSNTPPIDPSGKLPNGETFTSFEEFKALLYDQSDRFRRGLAEKVLVFALGRPTEPTDDSTLSTAVNSMKQDGDTFQALIKSLVASPQFLEK